MGTTPRPLRRRSSQEIQQTILEVARRLFNEQGYQATTTAQIAKEGAVSERLVFSNFGTKAELFNAAVVAPFAAVIRSYIDATVSTTQNSTWDDRIGSFVDGLYDLAREHRTALLTAVEASSSNSETPHDNPLDSLARSLHSMLFVVEPQEDHRDDYDGEASLATFVGMVFGVALLNDLIFPAGRRRPSRRRLIDEMRKTTLFGIMRHPTPWAPHPAASSRGTEKTVT